MAFKNMHIFPFRVARAPLGIGREPDGERLGKELGVDPTAVEFDMSSVKASLGLEENVDRMTYKDLQARRELIQKRMRDHVGR